MLAGINRLVIERTLRPQLPDLIAAIKSVAAGAPTVLALPENHEPVPAAIKAEVEAVLSGKKSIVSKIVQLPGANQYQAPREKSIQVERTEPMDALQLFWARRSGPPSLTCAGCQIDLQIGDWYEIKNDALYHAKCAGRQVVPV